MTHLTRQPNNTTTDTFPVYTLAILDKKENMGDPIPSHLALV